MKSFSFILLTYFLFIVSFVFFSFTFGNTDIPDFPFIYLPLVSSRVLIGSIYGIFILLFTGYFIYFLKTLSQKGKDKQSEFKKIVAISSLLIFSFPGMLSYDIFNYIATAKVTFFYQENPYIIMPIAFTNDVLLNFMHAANKTALYGPGWIGLTFIPHSLSLGNLLLTIYAFKFFTAIFYLLTVFTLYKMTKNLVQVALFALFPLVLIETFVSAHNDIVMMSFALLSFYFLQKRKIFFAVLLLTFSILIKFSTVFLIPVFILCIYKIYKKQTIDWLKMYLYSMIAMALIFFLSFIREEIYPWYSIWFLSFLPLVEISRKLKILILVFSLSLLFRYIPYLVTLNHFGMTPYIKMGITFLPVVIVACFIYSKSIWQKIF